MSDELVPTGVQFNPPPDGMFPEVMDKIHTAAAAIPEGKSGALIGVFQRDKFGRVSANAAIVQKIGPNTNVVAFVGKDWSSHGKIIYGAAVQRTW